jgi:hypothetical protein
MKWIAGWLLGLFLFALASAAQDSSSDPVAEQSGSPSLQDTSTNSGARASTDDVREIEAALHGFPAMFDLQGKKVADGEFTQWLQNDLLHVTIAYDLGSAHRIVEKTIVRQKPRLVQEEWSWRESQSGKLLRRFELDFKSGTVIAEKCTESKTSNWSESLKIEPGRTFAGFGFVLALKSVRDRLVAGEKVEFKAVGFTPKPRVVSVELSYGGLERMNMAGRTITGDQFVIHPKITAIAKAFVEVKDTHVWLTTPRPAGFLRWEGPLIEPGDSVARVDLLPGDHSGPAEPVRANRLQSK